jgi:hypothetical protein
MGFGYAADEITVGGGRRPPFSGFAAIRGTN